MPKNNEMSDRYILILGAGLMQKPAIEACRELGYKSLVLDANPNAVCVPYADRFECIDLKDREKIADFAFSMKDELAAVFTAGTDFSASVSHAAERCGLKSHSFEAAMNASNKVRMRECFKKHGVPSPDFFELKEESVEEFISKKLDGLKFPKVVKPVDNMGARGCRLVRNSSEFVPAIKDAVKFSRTKTAIVEDYMQGKEFSIDALVIDGKVTITGFADRHIFFEPYFIELGHTMPSEASDEVKKSVIDAFIKGVHALGLTNGVAKGDVKYTSMGGMIGEIAARLSGGYMSGWTYPYSSDVNLTKEAMKIALGEKSQHEGKEEIPSIRFSHERAFISIPGTVQKIYGEEKAIASPFVRNVFFRVKKGDDVDFPRNNVEKCGNIITVSEVRNLSLEFAEKAVSEIVLRLKPCNKKTDAFLSGRENDEEKGFPYNAYEFTEEEFAKVEKINSFFVIPKDSPCKEKIQELLDAETLSKKDWNYRTISKTLDIFDNMCKKHPELKAKEFIQALIRGGIQGILYMADSAK